MSQRPSRFSFLIVPVVFTFVSSMLPIYVHFVSLTFTLCLSLCSSSLCLFFFFFFQAEDGIRDLTVTGVQTCALPIYPPFNKAQPKFKKTMPAVFEKPDIVQIKCDVHSWMSGWIVVAGHAYYALTDAAGNFKIAGVPAGAYTLEYWHEKLGKQSKQVTVPATGSVTADLEYAAK